ncbi:MAG: YbhB/YbcL family Raf kinase inhibitor-like protein [Actinomycetales bacterium]|jgi:hypothetical protein
MTYDPYQDLPDAAEFTLSSESLADGGTLATPQLADDPSLGGANESPQLSWSGFPAATRSFAVTMYDPDAPTASGFWHWAAFNLPAAVTSLPAGAANTEGALPAGTVTLKNDGGFAGFMGAAPPAGHKIHRYMVVVHAVDVERLDIPAGATPAILGFNLFSHTLGRARITGLFGR